MNITYILYILWIFILPILGIGFPILAFIFLKFVLPETAKKLLGCKLFRKKIGCLLAIIRKGALKFVKAYDLAPGWIETEEGKKCLIPLPPKDKESWDPEDDLINKKTLLPDVGVPVLFCYEMDAIAVNGEVMAHLDAAATKVQDTVQLKTSNPGETQFITVLFPVEPSKISKAIENWISEDHMAVFEKDVEARVRSKGVSDWKSFALKVGTIIGAIVIVAIIAMVLVSQSTQSQATETAKMVLAMLKAI